MLNRKLREVFSLSCVHSVIQISQLQFVIAILNLLLCENTLIHLATLALPPCDHSCYHDYFPPGLLMSCSLRPRISPPSAPSWVSSPASRPRPQMTWPLTPIWSRTRRTSWRLWSGHSRQLKRPVSRLVKDKLLILLFFSWTGIYNLLHHLFRGVFQLVGIVLWEEERNFCLHK